MKSSTRGPGKTLMSPRLLCSHATFALIALRLLGTGAQTLKVEEVIARWDADHDGALSRDEIRQATGGQYEKVAEQLFQAVDRNGDGKLDPGELKGSAAGILLGQLR
jgi:Ca2+-binding EF-hand superfamily protein